MEYQKTEELKTEKLELNMGPQHPSMHGVLNLMLEVDGEIVNRVTPNIGYLHRCNEKIGENVTYTQFIPYTDRFDYLASMNNGLGFCLAVERLGGIAVPERAEYIRVIMAELNRIASHLIALGTHGLDIGSWTPVLYCFREREIILDLFEAACGARLTYSYMALGGVTKDLPEGFVQKALDFLDYFEPKLKEYNELLSYNKIFIDRTAKLGVMSVKDAIGYGVTGPNLRAAGFNWDLRKDEPYSVYNRLDFKVALGDARFGVLGDAWNRYFVRIMEMEESVKIVRQALKQLPQGEYRTKVSRALRLPAGEIYSATENPKGELGFYIISAGETRPARLKIRGPSFNNLSILPEITKGIFIADLISIVGSIDLVLGEVDR